MTATGYIFAAIAGAVLTGLANLIIELVKRSDDRKGIASAIAGEIDGILYSIKTRKLVEHFRELEKTLPTEEAPKPPWLHLDTTVDVAPIFKAYVERIGALKGSLPARIARFYTLFSAVRTELGILASGQYDHEPKNAAKVVARTLLVWERLAADGKELVRDLLALSGEQPPE